MKEVVKKRVVALRTLLMSALMCVTMSLPAWASDAGATVTPSDWSAIISAMTGQISVSTVVAVIASAIGAGIGLVFMWWGGRKAVRTLMAAFRKGKVSM